MKSHSFPPTTHTLAKRLNGVSLYAPCRNRTYNLMIKSQFGQLPLARTDSAQPHNAPVNRVPLVPQTPPKAYRTSPTTHTGLSA